MTTKSNVPYWFRDRYQQIISRCTRKAHKDYPNYGGRGITCEFNDAKEMWEHMKKLPNCKREMTIDRIDSDQNYKKGNMQWATRSEQCFNQRRHDNPLNQGVKELVRRGMLASTARKNLGITPDVEKVWQNHVDRIEKKKLADKIQKLGFHRSEAHSYIRISEFLKNTQQSV